MVQLLLHTFLQGSPINLSKIIFFILFNTLVLSASVQTYKNRANELKLHEKHYWQLLLHMNDGVSEIDDKNFFLSQTGATDAKSELEATLEAFFSGTTLDSNSTVCKFPARYRWLKEQLHARDFPVGECIEYDKIFKRVDPVSTTLVFPSAHINSPASMFGHTFLRINSSYHSKLLSYAINYAANANTETENGVIFAIKGLVGGYFGKYSLLPYYEKLKEYRDSEQRDIWEYDLNLSQEETIRMFEHIWELNGTYSDYFFFTENCSYNMLWLLEIARPTLHLRDGFNYQVLPLETVFETENQKLIISKGYRPSKRTKLLKYESLLNSNNLHYPVDIVDNNFNVKEVINSKEIEHEQKKYILESAIEYLEYRFTKAKVSKENYLLLFHTLTSQRAKLGSAKPLQIETPQNPLSSHRSIRFQAGVGLNEGESIAYLGIRPTYHDLEDSHYGFLRGTQIEFLNLLLSQTKTKSKVEKATIVSIVSLAQRSTFFKSFSWRTKMGWENNSIDDATAFSASVGAGYSWGNEFAYIYFLIDPIFYVKDGFMGAIGGSVGLNIDKYSFMQTNLEATHRFYDNGVEQTLLFASQGFRTSQNTQLVLKYDYKDKYIISKKVSQERFQLMFKYFY